MILSEVACGNKKPEYQTDNLATFLLLKWKHFESAKKKWEKGRTAKKIKIKGSSRLKEWKFFTIEKKRCLA